MLRRCVWSRNIKNGCSIYIYDISRLRVKRCFLHLPQKDRFYVPDINLCQHETRRHADRYQCTKLDLNIWCPSSSWSLTFSLDTLYELVCKRLLFRLRSEVFTGMNNEISPILCNPKFPCSFCSPLTCCLYREHIPTHASGKVVSMCRHLRTCQYKAKWTTTKFSEICPSPKTSELKYL